MFLPNQIFCKNYGLLKYEGKHVKHVGVVPNLVKTKVVYDQDPAL